MKEMVDGGADAEDPTLVDELLQVYNTYARDTNQTMHQLELLGSVAGTDHPGYKYKLGEVTKARSLLSDIGSVLIRHTAEPFDDGLEKLLSEKYPE